MTTDRMGHFFFDAVRSADIAWGIGCHGTIAEFMRDPDEPCALDMTDRMLTMTTDRGGIRLTLLPEIRPVEFSGRVHREIALCLPVDLADVRARTVLTEIGPDRDALHADHRDNVLFDLGIAAIQIEACVRTADPDLIALLREHAGSSLLESANPVIAAIVAASPHRIYRSRLGRIEVYQPIPAKGDKTPNGPHTHFNPHALRHRKAYPPRNPIPPGWLPCASLYVADVGGQTH